MGDTIIVILDVIVGLVFLYLLYYNSRKSPGLEPKFVIWFLSTIAFCGIVPVLVLKSREWAQQWSQQRIELGLCRRLIASLARLDSTVVVFVCIVFSLLFFLFLYKVYPMLRPDKKG